MRNHPHPLNLIYNIRIKTKPTTFIVLEVELPFKCNPEEFEKIYQEEYKNRITHEFIRSGLGISEGVRLKLNGTFGRWLYLLDENDGLYMVRYRIQTALWSNPETDTDTYVSIFPNFIKQYCQPCLHLLEHISCHVGKGEDILRYIDDTEGLVSCEDRFARIMKRLEVDCANASYPALLNSRYTEVYNRPITMSGSSIAGVRRYPWMFSLVATAIQYFGRCNGVLSLANTVILL